MKNKIITVLCILTSLLTLSSCQLSNNTNKEDNLIGYLVTYQDLYLAQLDNKENSKLYATSINQQGYETYRFNDISAAYFFFTYTSVYGNPHFSQHSYRAFSYDSQIQDYANNSNPSMTTSATLKIPYDSSNETGALFFYKIFQDQDERIYVYLEKQTALSFHYYDIGQIGRRYDSQLDKFKDDKLYSSLTVNIQFNIEVIYPSTKINVIQMSDNDIFVKNNEYYIDNIPETLTTENNTKYLIIETYFLNGNNEEEMSREIINHDGAFSTIVCDDFCEAIFIKVEW